MEINIEAAHKRVNYLAEKIEEYFIEEGAKSVAKQLKEYCCTDYARKMVAEDGYDNAYNALAYQCNYEHTESYDALISEIHYIADQLFFWLPEFVITLLEYEFGREEEGREHFCNSVFRKTLALVGSDAKTANLEAEKKAAAAVIPF
jgi:hypothetical protein